MPPPFGWIRQVSPFKNYIPYFYKNLGVSFKYVYNLYISCCGVLMLEFLLREVIMKKLLSIAISFLMLLAANTAFAVKVESLYQGQVSVTSQSQEEQNRAIQAALLQVLTKVSGNNFIANNSEIKSHLNDAAKWVLQVGYSNPHLLSVNFDSSGVNE